MSNPIEIETKDLNLLMSRMNKFKGAIARYMSAMAHEAGQHVIKQKGLMRYPPSTEANKPGRYSLKTHRAMPYYIRGRGMQYKSGNNYKSERYGTQFYVKREGDHAIIGNRASYAKYLASEDEQSEVMAKYGWRKLIDVAKEQMPAIKKIFDKWVQKALKEVGL